MSLDFLLKGQLSFLNGFYNIIAVSGFDDHLIEVAKREKVKTISIKMQRTISPLKDIQALWNLYILFKKEQPYIVHSITPKAGLLSMLAAKMAGVPVRIHTFTGLIFPTKTGMMQRILIIMDRVLCWSATVIIPEGHGVKNDLIKHKITSKPLKILANGNVNGINMEHFSLEKYTVVIKENLRKTLQLQSTDFVFIFVGRLVGDKGINELVSAFKDIKKKYKDAKLLLVGPLETELDALLSETLQEIENNKSIISVGFQDDVRPYFAISDALVFPSYREGFPNVVLQAGAMELPSIVSDINGCNEIIIEGVNGLIIPSKNTIKLKEAMLKFLLDPTLLQQLKMNSRTRIIENYEQSIVWEALLQEYRNTEKNV